MGRPNTSIYKIGERCGYEKEEVDRLVRLLSTGIQEVCFKEETLVIPHVVSISAKMQKQDTINGRKSRRALSYFCKKSKTLRMKEIQTLDFNE